MALRRFSLDLAADFPKGVERRSARTNRWSSRGDGTHPWTTTSMHGSCRIRATASRWENASSDSIHCNRGQQNRSTRVRAGKNRGISRPSPPTGTSKFPSLGDPGYCRASAGGKAGLSRVPSATRPGKPQRQELGENHAVDDSGPLKTREARCRKPGTGKKTSEGGQAGSGDMLKENRGTGRNCPLDSS